MNTNKDIVWTTKTAISDVNYIPWIYMHAVYKYSVEFYMCIGLFTFMHKLIPCTNSCTNAQEQIHVKIHAQIDTKYQLIPN